MLGNILVGSTAKETGPVSTPRGGMAAWAGWGRRFSLFSSQLTQEALGGHLPKFPHCSLWVFSQLQLAPISALVPKMNGGFEVK